MKNKKELKAKIEEAVKNAENKLKNQVTVTEGEGDGAVEFDSAIVANVSSACVSEALGKKEDISDVIEFSSLSSEAAEYLNMVVEEGTADDIIEDIAAAAKPKKGPIVWEYPDENRRKKRKNTDDKEHMSEKTKRRISNTIAHIVLVLMSVIWIIPFIFILLESFRVESTGLAGYIIPKKWGIDNYVNLFTKTEFGKWFLNTFLLGLAVAVVQTVIVLAVSYVLSRTRFKGRKTLMNFMLILGMFPGFLTLILLYNLLTDWHMTEASAPIGLFVVYVASSGMGYYISKGYFDTIPRSLDEAARVDGATRAQIMYKVILPMAKPIVIYTVLMGFMAPWGDFIFATYVAHNTQAGMNVAAGLQFLISSPSSLAANYTMFCAGGVVVAIPIALLFMFLQKYYVAGVTGGAVKG